MGLRKWFGKAKGEDESFQQDLTLSSMTPGCLVDYDLTTWEVTDTSTHDYDGDETREWELRSAQGEVRFLERSEDEGRIEMTLTCRISLKDLEEDVAGTILEEDDPPEIVTFKGRRYHAEEASTGLRLEGESDAEDDEGEGREFVNWSYAAEDRRVLFVVRWGDRDFAAYEGQYVEDYQFTDILPRA